MDTQDTLPQCTKELQPRKVVKNGMQIIQFSVIAFSSRYATRCTTYSTPTFIIHIEARLIRERGNEDRNIAQGVS